MSGTILDTEDAKMKGITHVLANNHLINRCVYTLLKYDVVISVIEGLYWKCIILICDRFGGLNLRNDSGFSSYLKVFILRIKTTESLIKWLLPGSHIKYNKYKL